MNRKTLLPVLILLMFGAGCHTASAPRATDWVIGLDTTDSITPHRLAVMKEMIQRLIFPNVRPYDRVAFMPIKGKSGDEVVKTLDTSQTPQHKLGETLANFFQSFIAPVTIEKSKGSDFSGAISFAHRWSKISTSKRRVVLLLLGDGHAEGEQSQINPISADEFEPITIWCGIDAGREEEILEFSKTKGIHAHWLIRLSDWEAVVPVFKETLKSFTSSNKEPL